MVNTVSQTPKPVWFSWFLKNGFLFIVWIKKISLLKVLMPGNVNVANSMLLISKSKKSAIFWQNNMQPMGEKEKKKKSTNKIPLYTLLQRWHEFKNEIKCLKLYYLVTKPFMNYWGKSVGFFPYGRVNGFSESRSVALRKADASSWQPLSSPAQDSTCINWREASKSSTGYILIRKNFIPIIKLIMLWTTYGLCSLCRNSLSSAINFFFTAGNLRREREWFIK